MRIDKFLKNSRIIKRRQVAKSACEDGRVKVNGSIAKPSTEVKEGDEVEVTFGNRILNVKVKYLIEGAKKDNAYDMYEEINE
ncbi:MAG: RNA-binding S4 domain-containing protein [Tissierellia bacterium]|nr:RNA-binding S4 domain-containing protein [Tissierellia bacterium]